MSCAVFQSAVLRRTTYTSKEICGPPLEERLQFDAKCPLIIASQFNGTAQHFYRVLSESSQAVNWICPEDILDCRISVRTAEALIRSASGIYFRESCSAEPEFTIAAAVLRCFTLLHVNLVAAEASNTNWSKPNHGRTIKRLAGERLISANEWIANRDILPAGVVKKSMGGFPSYIEVTAAAEHVDEMTFAQEHISGEEYRVHVFEQTIFASKLTRCGVDYRRDGLAQVEWVSLPDDLCAVLVELTVKEGLRFSGIDVIRRDDRYFVIEVNPMPGYHSYEIRANAGYPITRALYDSLLIR